MHKSLIWSSFFLVSEPGDRYSVELPPELCRIIMSPVSANNLHIFSYVPSIMFRIQCMLLSVKLKVQLGPTVQQFDVPVLKVDFLINSFLFMNY
jgi:endoribonuclease Dicer